MKTDKYFEKYLEAKFIELQNEIKELKEAVLGNGKKGLYHRVEELEGFKQYILGTIFVISSIAGTAVSFTLDWLKKSLGLK